MTTATDVRLAVAAATDVGSKRTANEDSYLAESPAFIVADGMGGYEAGDRASRAVVDAFRRRVVDAGAVELADIRSALTDADVAVAEVAAGTRRGAGSTVTGVVLIEHDGAPHWLVVNVGDSRVYRHVGSELEQLTVDHSLGQELVDRGELKPEELRTFIDRNVITRAIGAPDSSADSWLMPVTDGERLLVCSDGLHSEITDEAIRATLTMSGRPAAAAGALVDLALRAGGRDNVTVIVVDVLSGGADPSDDGTTVTPLTGAIEETDGTTIPVRA